MATAGTARRERCTRLRSRTGMRSPPALPQKRHAPSAAAGPLARRRAANTPAALETLVNAQGERKKRGMTPMPRSNDDPPCQPRIARVSTQALFRTEAATPQHPVTPSIGKRSAQARQGPQASGMEARMGRNPAGGSMPSTTARRRHAGTHFNAGCDATHAPFARPPAPAHAHAGLIGKAWPGQFIHVGATTHHGGPAWRPP